MRKIDEDNLLLFLFDFKNKYVMADVKAPCALQPVPEGLANLRVFCQSP